MRARLHTLAAALGRAGRFAVREDSLLSSAYIGGVAAIAIGAGLVLAPAGLIVGGLLSAGSAVAYARGRRGGGEE